MPWYMMQKYISHFMVFFELNIDFTKKKSQFLFLFSLFSRHNQVSDLHKNNMEAWHREHRPQSGAASAASAMASNFAGGRYRDRAQERRQKYGIDDEGPRPNRLKEKYLQAVEDAEFSSNNSSSSSSNRGGSGGGGSSHNNKGREKAIDESNIGSKMLQKMGWKEGLGLGKANQGRTSIIEVRNEFG